jgi:hypothetical protein
VPKALALGQTNLILHFPADCTAVRLLQSNRLLSSLYNVQYVDGVGRSFKLPCLVGSCLDL